MSRGMLRTVGIRDIQELRMDRDFASGTRRIAGPIAHCGSASEKRHVFTGQMNGIRGIEGDR